jgi:transposase InsO family protein
MSELLREVCRLLQISMLCTSPYHAMCNGLCEKFNGVLKKMLKAFWHVLGSSHSSLRTAREPLICLPYNSSNGENRCSHLELLCMRIASTEYVRPMLNALISLFSRVGIPKEMLTDQGSNFMSELLREVCRLLQISMLWVLWYIIKYTWPKKCCIILSLVFLFPRWPANGMVCPNLSIMSLNCLGNTIWWILCSR